MSESSRTRKIIRFLLGTQPVGQSEIKVVELQQSAAPHNALKSQENCSFDPQPGQLLRSKRSGSIVQIVGRCKSHAGHNADHYILVTVNGYRYCTHKSLLTIPSVDEFKPGTEVRICSPRSEEKRGELPTWVDEMDRLDGRTTVVIRTSKQYVYTSLVDFAFSPSWLDIIQ